jgi:putative radical SAM enzyme (TIGR03279 family)
MTANGVKIIEVLSGSVAGNLGIIPGDRILTVNGHTVSDELDLRFYLSEDTVDLFVQRTRGSAKHFKIDPEDIMDLGIIIEEFQTRRCNNACLFCFVDQLPPNVRTGLKVKDDDFRLSFLHGNYITLTNLTEIDLNRIVEQRLSPLYVSIHTTDTALRTQILGRTKADNSAKKLRKLIRGGIHIHAQIVLMPGINDQAHLEKTVHDLYLLFPGVQSIAIVPVGLSDYGAPRKRLKAVTPAQSRKLIRTVSQWQERFRKETGCAFACLADEFYLQAGLEVPGRDHYDDFAQIEDGVGMVRTFLDDFQTEIKRRRKSIPACHGTLVTGKLFAPILQRCIEQWNRLSGANLKICAVENRFLGKKITVAGLLAGADIMDALKNSNPGDFIIIPEEALSSKDRIFVDDLSLRDLSRKLGKPVYASGRTMRDFFKLLTKLSVSYSLRVFEAKITSKSQRL